MTLYEGATLQYKDVARKIEKLHIIFNEAGIEKGDKIAVCGRNSSQWAAAFLAVLTYGAVAVPILHEFTPEQIYNILEHSESKLFFVGDQVWPDLNADKMPGVQGIFGLHDFSLMVSRSETITNAREKTERIVRKEIPQKFQKGTRKLSQGRARRTCNDKLHIGNHKPVKRCHDSLSCSLE